MISFGKIFSFFKVKPSTTAKPPAQSGLQPANKESTPATRSNPSGSPHTKSTVSDVDANEFKAILDRLIEKQKSPFNRALTKAALFVPKALKTLKDYIIYFCTTPNMYAGHNKGQLNTQETALPRAKEAEDKRRKRSVGSAPPFSTPKASTPKKAPKKSVSAPPSTQTPPVEQDAKGSQKFNININVNLNNKEEEKGLRQEDVDAHGVRLGMTQADLEKAQENTEKVAAEFQAAINELNRRSSPIPAEESKAAPTAPKQATTPEAAKKEATLEELMDELAGKTPTDTPES